MGGAIILRLETESKHGRSVKLHDGMGALIVLNECVCSHNGPLDVLAYISFYTDNMEIEFPVLEQHIPWFP